MNEPNFIKQYKRKVKKLIPYNYPDRKRVLCSITEMLSEYMDEFPETEYEDLIEAHGTPEKLAASLLGSLDDDTTLNLHKKQNKKYLYTTAIVLASVICIAAVGMLHNKNSDIYIEERTTITRYVTPEKSYEMAEYEDLHEKLPETISEIINAQLDGFLYELFHS